MVITVTRTNKTTDGIFGNLSLDTNPFRCVTMEIATRAIPVGIYGVDWMWSDHFQQVMPQLIVPGRTAIELHWANFPLQLEGCIALGTTVELSKDWITESKIAWVSFIKAILNQPVLTIKVVEDLV